MFTVCYKVSVNAHYTAFADHYKFYFHFTSLYIYTFCPNQQNLGIFLPIKRGTMAAALELHLLLGFLSVKYCLFHADNGRKTAS